MKKHAYEVGAEAHTDDWAVEVTFDAADWLKTASDAAIFDLASDGWMNGYGADQVAHDLAETNGELASLFTYLEQVNRSTLRETVGFEVAVDAEAAIAWLRVNRPTFLTSHPLVS